MLKYVEVDYHFIHDKIDKGALSSIYFFSKPVGRYLD